MKKNIFIWGILLLSACNIYAQTIDSIDDIEDIEKRIESFYSEYFKAKSLQVMDSLRNTFLTPKMQKKLGRMNHATGSDQLIRAQDISDWASQSVRCRHLSKNWYEISYQFRPNDSLIYIPLKIVYKEKVKDVRIDHVVPE